MLSLSPLVFVFLALLLRFLSRGFFLFHLLSLFLFVFLSFVLFLPGGLLFTFLATLGLLLLLSFHLSHEFSFLSSILLFLFPLLALFTGLGFLVIEQEVVTCLLLFLVLCGL